MENEKRLDDDSIRQNGNSRLVDGPESQNKEKKDSEIINQTRESSSKSFRSLITPDEYEALSLEDKYSYIAYHMPRDTDCCIRRAKILANNRYEPVQMYLAEVYKHGQWIKEDLNGAISIYKEIIAHSQDKHYYTEAAHTLGRVYHSLGNYEEAQIYYEIAIKCGDHFAEINLAQLERDKEY